MVVSLQSLVDGYIGREHGRNDSFEANQFNLAQTVYLERWLTVRIGETGRWTVILDSFEEKYRQYY